MAFVSQSVRPRKTAKERRGQKSRATGRAIQHLLQAFEALGSHRGSQPSKLGAALSTLLKLGEHADPLGKDAATFAHAQPPVLVAHVVPNIRVIDEYTILEDALQADDPVTALAEIAKLKLVTCMPSASSAPPPSSDTDADGHPHEDAVVCGEDSAAEELRVGAHVLIHGLAARADLNGRRGFLREGLPGGRWAVQLFPPVKFGERSAPRPDVLEPVSISIKAANLSKLLPFG